MTNEKQEALRALERIEENNILMHEVRGFGTIAKADIETIRAALTEAPKVDVEGLKQRISDLLGEKLDGNILTCQEWAIKFTLDHLTTHFNLVKKSEEI